MNLQVWLSCLLLVSVFVFGSILLLHKKDNLPPGSRGWPLRWATSFNWAPNLMPSSSALPTPTAHCSRSGSAPNGSSSPQRPPPPTENP
ncbi:unnamed protein product [Victoria cruziana]